VVVKEAKTPELFQVVRTQLIPGLLKVLSENQSYPMPIKIFEVSDVSVLVSPPFNNIIHSYY
jgi:phenylalanyl-tRNA synthetase beta subunit